MALNILMPNVRTLFPVLCCSWHRDCLIILFPLPFFFQIFWSQNQDVPSCHRGKWQGRQPLQVLDLVSFLRSRTSLVSHRPEFRMYMERSRMSPLFPTPPQTKKGLLLFLSHQFSFHIGLQNLWKKNQTWAKCPTSYQD